MKPKIRVTLEADFYDVEQHKTITMGRCECAGTVRVFYLGLKHHNL